VLWTSRTPLVQSTGCICLMAQKVQLGCDK
jgi:hypothetical protein